MQVYIILALLVSLLVTVFAVQNNAVITVTLFAWRIEGSLAIILMGTLFLGILVGLFLLTPSAIRGRLSSSDLRKRLQKVEQEKEQLRKVQVFPEMPQAEDVAPAKLGEADSEGGGAQG